MTDAREIYRHYPDQYDALVSREDHSGQLLKALRQLVRLEEADEVEFGAGTGRVTALLAPLVRSLRAFDLEPAMLDVARRKLSELTLRNWQIDVADNARLPVADDSADVSIAAWSYGHQTVWHPGSWREPIEAAIGEMRRVLRPGGTAIVIETLGTGHREPFAPPPELARYYALLTEEHHFERTWIRTDYQFPSASEGERLVRFFFGDELADAYVASESASLPECTGLWCWKKPAAAAGSARRRF
jgi:ubiquinone/menaquinone biosynthesis C-methylase UbiE